MSAQDAVRPSEAAQLFAQIMRAMPQEAVVELSTMLNHQLGVETPAGGRWKQLRLLVLLVQDGEVPRVNDYMAAREREIAAGRYAPTASALCDDYGCWSRAVRAAMRFACDGSAARVSRRPKKTGGGGDSYWPRQVLNAIRRAYRVHNAWPTEWEYGEWAQLDRELKRRSGAGDSAPRTPGLAQIRKLFDDYATALAEAQASTHADNRQRKACPRPEL